MADFYFDNICILYVVLLDAGSVTGAEKKKVWERERKSTFLLLQPGFCNLSHASAVSSSYLCRRVTASYETPWQPEEMFYCDVKTHPSSRSRHYERGCMLYRVCSLNFHRLSCFPSHSAVTGSISNAHAICDMSSPSFDEENKVLEIPYSDRWESALSIFDNHMFSIFPRRFLITDFAGIFFFFFGG